MSAKSFWIRTALGLFLVTSLGAWSLSHWYLNSYFKEVGERLELLMELRKGAVEQYFSTAQAELTFWSSNLDILAAQAEFNALGDGDTGSGYSAIHDRLHPLAQLFVTERAYYDMFLISVAGDVYYSVEKESDFGSNLMTGPWRDSGLGEVFRLAMIPGQANVVISDMQAYGPSGDAPAIFIAKAMLNPAGDVTGVIAFQLPTSKIVEIMAYTPGMGDTGETYLVGQDGLMRSNSRFSESPTILTQTVDSHAAAKALAGRSGVEFLTDYRGIEVMSAYSALKVGENSWAVIAEFDRDEIVASAAEEQPSLTATLLFIYGLSLWSVWYWRGSQSEGEAMGGIADLDMGSLGDSSDFGGS